MRERAIKVALVGNPNVGKSVLFNALTGATATISNYPGTTVTVSRGKFLSAGKSFEVIDTPGMYSFLSITEEERIARAVLLHDAPDVVVNVTDARNMRRMLPLTLQLIEASLPTVLVLNMMDEAMAAGISIDVERLSREIRVPVVPMVATKKIGIEKLIEIIRDYHDNGKTFDAVS